MTDTAFHQEDDQILSGLQQAAGDQNAPSPEGAASQGALGAPASAGRTQPKPTELAAGQTYHDMWQEAPEEDQMATVEAMEEQLGAQGTGIIAKTNEIASNAMAQKDGKTLNLLLKWGWKPPEERPAFDPSSMEQDAGPAAPTDAAFVQEGPPGPEGALPEPEVGPPEEMGPPEGLSDEQVAQQKKSFNRRKMGGFLMELGLNILSSNRDDAGAAVGDAFGRTVASREQRKRTSAAESLATSEREREQRRQEESDQFKRNKEEREQRKEVRDQIASERSGLVEITNADGTVEFVDKRKGKVYLESGEEARKATKYDTDRSDFLSAGGRETTARANRRAIDDMVGAIKEEIGVSSDPAIESLGDGEDYMQIVQLAKKRLMQQDPSYNFNIDDDADNDPLGLL